MSTSAATVANTLASLSMHSFVDELRRIHDNTAHQSFAFLLGAGASVSSGIAPAARLAKNWLEELHKQDPAAASNTFDSWLAAGSHGITGLDPTNLAASYPAIFDRRFGTNPNLGYAVLTNLMKDAEPGFGYSVLATMLATERHKTVITTNFDNLVERALLYYTNHTPLTCTHETTAGIFRRAVSRPLIIKCHRDLLLDPHNGQAGTSKLNENYGAAIKSLLPGKALIVIGYGGNDGSLMEFLETLENDHAPEAVYWCYWIPDGPPTGRAAAWIAQRKGSIVPIEGFDELFYQVRKAFDLPLLDSEMDALHAKRKAKYRDQAEAIAKRMGDGTTPTAPEPVVDLPPASSVTPSTVAANTNTPKRRKSRRGANIRRSLARRAFANAAAGNVTSWEELLPVLEMTDGPAKDAAFQALLLKYPSDPEVFDRYAAFLCTYGNLTAAEKYARKALILAENRFRIDAPDLARFHNNLATIQQAQGDLVGARTSIERAIVIDSKHFAPDAATFAINHSNLAMIQEAQGDLAGARESIERAIAIDSKHLAPDHPDFASLYSNLAKIQHAQGDLAGARESIERAIAIDSKHFAPDHFNHAINGYKLGLIEAAEGKKAQACQTFKVALALFRKHFKDDHFRVVRLLKSMKDNGCPM